jgi:hypothetical protein
MKIEAGDRGWVRLTIVAKLHRDYPAVNPSIGQSIV